MKQACITSFFQNKTNAKHQISIVNTVPKINLSSSKIQIPVQHTLFFDGCSKGNPGPAGAGAVIYQGNTEIWSKSLFVGNNSTNNVAEYTGLIIGLHEAVNKKIKELIVKGDSMLVIKQMKGEYKVNSKDMLRLYENAKGFEKYFDKIVYEHVYRDHNKRADQLSNEGLHAQMNKK
uniref:RNase H type-1 domain-containing protein n=1 Tax=viral metagenome TaxID=1070528 RepID=A0A6C0ETC3_9ZZZZ